MPLLYPQIRLSVPDHQEQPCYLTVFIGGFGDLYIGISHRLYSRFSGFLESLPFCKSYYHWDGKSFGVGLLRDHCHRIALDIMAVWERFPGIPVVIVGHSYGGSAAMQVAREIESRCRGGDKLLVLTIDAVSRRQPKTRAEGLFFWGNAYLSEGGGPVDIIPRIGGRWGKSPEADLDIAFSGYSQCTRGKLYSHRRPEPMILDTPGDHTFTLFDKVREMLDAKIPSF